MIVLTFSKVFEGFLIKLDVGTLNLREKMYLWGAGLIRTVERPR